ncbi:hypothetical protein MPS_2675 [Mycobacterium pseudoshottsii JCM 15466]|nr:hypothetical protein MPS_2675 [Mycobacterium pseudoshottsii JCM 15466]
MPLDPGLRRGSKLTGGSGGTAVLSPVGADPAASGAGAGSELGGLTTNALRCGG